MIQFNSRVCMSRYAQIARALGLPGATDKQLTDSLVEAVRAMNAKLGIAQTYQANGVSEEDFKATARPSPTTRCWIPAPPPIPVRSATRRCSVS